MAVSYKANWVIRTQDKDGTKLRFSAGDKVEKVDPVLMENLVKSGAVTASGEVEKPQPQEPKDEPKDKE